MNDTKKRTVEDTPGIRAHDFQQYARMVAITGHGLEGELRFLDETLPLSLSRHNGIVEVKIDSTAVVLDGQESHLVPGVVGQWYFICPKCERRCKYLYRPTLDDDFACRECHDLTYQSILEQHKNRALFKAVGAEMGMDWKTVREMCDWMVPGLGKD